MKVEHVGIITQARMTSSRLPGKVLKTVNGVSLLKYHIDRLRRSGIPVFVATTTNATDDPIVAFCQEEGVGFHRGDENNVLERFYDCALKFGLKTVIRVTSDCPLIDGSLIEKGVSMYQDANDKNAYLSNSVSRTFPRGLDFEVFGFNLLKEAHENAEETFEKEHVTPYLYNGKNPDIHLVSFEHSEKKDQYRITVDTPEDFELIEALIEQHDADQLDTLGIIKILDENPQLVTLNKHIEQKKLGE